MTSPLRFTPPVLPAELDVLRQEVRTFLENELRAGTWERQGLSWSGFNPALSRRLGDRGWIGVTWPRAYGGGEGSYLERYVITEELLASGAPTGAHWVADRQSGPLLLRFGTEAQKERFLPPITRGESYFCIGMSEPDSGSDLASIRSRAEAVRGGFKLNGTKLWTSRAHQAHYIIVLCRTEPPGSDRHAGMSQLVVDLSSPGISVRPIPNLLGEHDFNEVVFDDVFVPEDHLVGEVGNGWHQVTSELAYERSGPERFLSNYDLLVKLIAALPGSPSREVKRALGELVSELWTLRQMSLSVAGMLQSGEMPNTEAAVVKDLGTHFQQRLPEVVRGVVAELGEVASELSEELARAILKSPAYTIQGGTTEILRGIVARGLQLR